VVKKDILMLKTHRVENRRRFSTPCVFSLRPYRFINSIVLYCIKTCQRENIFRLVEVAL